MFGQLLALFEPSGFPYMQQCEQLKPQSELNTEEQKLQHEENILLSSLTHRKRIKTSLKQQQSFSAAGFIYSPLTDEKRLRQNKQ